MIVSQAMLRAGLQRRLRDVGQRFNNELLDEGLQTAFAACFPKFYKNVYSAATVVPVNGYVTVPAGQRAEHVYDTEDSTEIGVSIGMPGRRGTQIGPLLDVAEVVLVSYEAFVYPTDLDIPDEMLELVYLHAKATVIESLLVDKTNYRRWQPNEPDSVDENELIGLVDQIMGIYGQRMDEVVGMGLPVVRLV